MGDRQVAELDEVCGRTRELDRLVRAVEALEFGVWHRSGLPGSRALRRAVLGEERLDRRREPFSVFDEAEVIRIRDHDEARRRNRVRDEARRLDRSGIELAVHDERRARDRSELAGEIVFAESP